MEATREGGSAVECRRRFFCLAKPKTKRSRLAPVGCPPQGNERSIYPERKAERITLSSGPCLNALAGEEKEKKRLAGTVSGRV
jgi:hypothetical protein